MLMAVEKFTMVFAWVCRLLNVGPFSVDATDNLSFIYSMTDLLISFFALLGIWVWM